MSEGSNGNGNGVRVPAWVMAAAVAGGLGGGGLGGAKIANTLSDDSDVPAILGQCLRRSDRLEWRIERLENRFQAPAPRLP